MNTGLQRFFPWLKKAFLLMCDSFSVIAAYYCTLLFRSGGVIEPRFETAYYDSIVLLVAVYIASYFAFHLYSSLWEHASIDELIQTAAATAVATAICAVLAVMFEPIRLPTSVYIASSMILVLMVGWVRMFYRILRRAKNYGWRLSGKSPQKVLIIGAGNTGAAIIKQMQDSRDLNKAAVAIVDDDAGKQNTRVYGIKVMGTIDDIPQLCALLGINEIAFCIPSASQKERRRVFEICSRVKCDIKTVPGIEAMLGGVRFEKMRDVDINDLLEREEVKLDIDSVSGYLNDSVILVTGGGGSIGSELCRQIAKFKPKKLIIFDIYENNAYELLMDLKNRYGEKLDVNVVIGSVRDIKRLDEVFGLYKPDVVFHAAAHKHVPLMEDNPAEAVKNNVFGTFNVAQAAHICGSKRFVLISTDKAVNPTNVMGATKYLCELIVQYMNHKSSDTRFVAVRFGNVLGSNGSVIPLFRHQIENGGPVTVTHKDMKRFFMTIPEAARLVIQAGSMAKEGQIFILEMGDLISIDQFARTFIRLSGFEPDVDIKIVYTGLRPGEKMYEELLQDDEQVEKTSFKGIMVGRTHEIPPEEINRHIDWLFEQTQLDDSRVPEYLAQVVPSYKRS